MYRGLHCGPRYMNCISFNQLAHIKSRTAEIARKTGAACSGFHIRTQGSCLFKTKTYSEDVQ